MSEIITIDGPTSSGKNSVGFLLAKKLGYQYTDTGMIYRAGAYQVIKHKISLGDKDRIVNEYKKLSVFFKIINDKNRFFLDGKDVTELMHTPDVSRVVPIVAQIPEVREIMKPLQRKIGNSQATVMSGRDIGSGIFPEAKNKFYLTADIEVRAKRRFNQLHKDHPGLTYDEVLNDLVERDRQDMERKIAPLKVPEGAIVIDNSHLNVEQTVDKILQIIGQKL